MVHQNFLQLNFSSNDRGFFLLYSLGLPELLEGLGEHESDCDHHHDCLREEPHAALVQLTSVHRRTPELEVLPLRMRMMLFWFSLPARLIGAVRGALEDLLVVALVAVGRRGDLEGGPVSLGRGLGIPLLGDVVNLKI